MRRNAATESKRSSLKTCPRSAWRICSAILPRAKSKRSTSLSKRMFTVRLRLLNRLLKSFPIVIGFNVRPDSGARNLAEQEKVDVRTYRIIYQAIEDVENAMKGMFKPVFKEVHLGTISVRNTFKVSSVGTIAGAYVQDGKVQRNAQVRVVRDGVVVHEGQIASLRRFKDDVREVAAGYECGIGIENFNDIHEGDVIEAYTMEEVKR